MLFLFDNIIQKKNYKINYTAIKQKPEIKIKINDGFTNIIIPMKRLNPYVSYKKLGV